jgi:O-antigen ligase
MSTHALARPLIRQRPQKQALLVLYIVFAVAMPLTFFVFPSAEKVRVTAWAWFLDLFLIGTTVLIGPLHARAVRYLLPYLAFLICSTLSLAWTLDAQKGFLAILQMTVPALAYLLAWRVRSRAAELKDQIAQACTVAMGLMVVVMFIDTVGIVDVQASLRPAAISLSVIFLGATLTTRSSRWTVLVGIVAVGISAFTGARMATAVLLILFGCSPSLKVRTSRRILVAGVIFLAVLGISETSAFKHRFFFDPDASLTDAFTWSDKLDTSGRREAWPRIMHACSSSPVFGKGIGSAAVIASAGGNGDVFDQPHNDYLRTYCDTGLIGSVLFWMFFLFAGIRSARMAHHSISDRRLHASASLLILVLFIFAITDNPIVYTAHFMAPLAVIVGLSDATWHRNVELRATYTAQVLANQGVVHPTQKRLI